MSFTHHHLMQEKNWKPGLYRQQAQNILELYLQLFCQQIAKKTIHW